MLILNEFCIWQRFPFPLMSTCVHFLSVFIYCGLARAICARCRENTPTLDWGLYIKKVFLTGKCI